MTSRAGWMFVSLLQASLYCHFAGADQVDPGRRIEDRKGNDGHRYNHFLALVHTHPLVSALFLPGLMQGQKDDLPSSYCWQVERVLLPYLNQVLDKHRISVTRAQHPTLSPVITISLELCFNMKKNANIVVFLSELFHFFPNSLKLLPLVWPHWFGNFTPRFHTMLLSISLPKVYFFKDCYVCNMCNMKGWIQ